jgi:hypothetical protein
MANDTTLIYNTVPLAYIETAEVNSEAVTDTLAGKDLLYVRHTIRVEAVITPGSVPSLPGESAAATLARVEHLLSVPRRPFVYAVAGVPLYRSDGLDPAGGPVPVPPKITKVTPTTFRVEYQIVVCTNDCAELGLPRPLWTSLRWTQDQVIDEENYSTLITTGRLVANADMLKRLRSIDDLRGVVVPPVPPNFIRHSKYTIAADGLTLDFLHTDQEQYILPPADAAKMDGHARQYFVKGGGRWFGEVDLTLEGRKDAPKWRLMATALSVAFNRLKKMAPKIMLLEGSMEESFKRNAVHVKLMAMTPPANEIANANGNGVAYTFGKVVGDLVIAAALQKVPVAGNILAVGYLASQVTDAVKQAREKAKADAQKLKQPDAGIVPGDLSQWGSPLLGCNMPGDPPAAGIGPELYGNLPAFRLFAAAFRDPCLDNTVSIARAAAQQYDSEFNQPTYPKPATLGVGQVRPTYPATSQVLVLNGLPPVLPVQLNSVVDPYPGVFTETHVEVEYRHKPNTCVLPRTVAGQVGVQVSWANPEIEGRYTWTMGKAGGPPTLPDPTPKDTNTVLVGSCVLPESVELGPDGVTFWYNVSGCFDYQFLDPNLVNFVVPVPPWLPVDPGQLPAPPTTTNALFAGSYSSALKSQQK